MSVENKYPEILTEELLNKIFNELKPLLAIFNLSDQSIKETIYDCVNKKVEAGLIINKDDEK